MSDQLTPNVMTVAPDGSIGANFTGHVKAAGLDLSVVPAAPKGGTAAVISWYRADNGGLLAELWGFDNSDAGGDTNLTASLDRSAANRGGVRLDLIVRDPNGTAGPPRPNALSVRAWKGSDPNAYTERVLLTSGDVSDYVQAGGPDTPARVRLAGIYAAAIPALAQGATAAVDVETGITLPARYVAVGLPATVGYGNTYGYSAGATATAVRILAACPWVGGQPATTFYFAVLMAG